MRRVLVLFVAAGALTLPLAACGGDSEDSQFSFGKPGEAAKAKRTVEVHQKPELRFEPEDVSVKSGDTVTFKIINDDKVLHEFDLGDQAFQDSMMKQMEGAQPGARMADEPNAIAVKAGETRELT